MKFSGILPVIDVMLIAWNGLWWYGLFTPWKLTDATNWAVLVVVSFGNMFVIHSSAHDWFAAVSSLLPPEHRRVYPADEPCHSHPSWMHSLTHGWAARFQVLWPPPTIVQNKSKLKFSSCLSWTPHLKPASVWKKEHVFLYLSKGLIELWGLGVGSAVLCLSRGQFFLIFLERPAGQQWYFVCTGNTAVSMSELWFHNLPSRKGIVNVIIWESDGAKEMERGGQ